LQNSQSFHRFLAGAGHAPKTAQILFSKVSKNAKDYALHSRMDTIQSNSSIESKSSTPQHQENSLDLDKLARSVSIAETSGCTKGSALSVKNCFGIMQFDKKGNRSLKRFNTHQDSFKEFKRIWSMHYKEFPDQKLANKWVNGNFGATTKGSIEWLSTVIQQYNQS